MARALAAIPRRRQRRGSRRLERGDALVGVELDQSVDEHLDLPTEHARHAGARHVAAMVGDPIVRSVICPDALAPVARAPQRQPLGRLLGRPLLRQGAANLRVINQ